LAERLEPGYAPTLFNRALCALLSDLPENALVWLVRYRARCPEDVQAMRLQFNLLVQLDRADEAMDTLGAYLAKQPPTHPLLLDAAIQAAQMNRVSDAIRYLEIAQKGQAPMVIARIYQSPAFREIRLSPEGTAFAERLAKRARAALVRSSAVHAKVDAAPSAPRIPVNPKFH
jgi:predicted Zn-dependent protease